MSTTPEVGLPADLVVQVMQLPQPALRKLAALIHDAIDQPDDPELVRKEWNEVIKQRIEGYLNGTIPAEDWREQLARVRRRLAENDSQ